MATSRRSATFWLFVILSSLLVLNDIIVPLVVNPGYIAETYFASAFTVAMAAVFIALPSIGIALGLVLLLRRDRRAKRAIIISMLPYTVIGILALLVNNPKTESWLTGVPVLASLNAETYMKSLFLLGTQSEVLYWYSLFNQVYKYVAWVLLLLTFLNYKLYDPEFQVPSPKAAAGSQRPQETKRGVKNPYIYAGTIVVLVIVVIAFVFMPMTGGSGGGIGGGQSLTFGKFAGKPIVYGPSSYMAYQVNDLNERMRRQGLTEENFPIYAYQVYRGAFERAALRVGILETARRSGLSVTEPWLDKKVAESPYFQEDGKFSVRKYQAAPLSQKLSVRNDIRDETVYQAYINDSLGFAPSSQEVAFVKQMAKETRTVQYVALPLSKYPDSEAEAWGKAHAELFRGLSLSRVTIESSEADAKRLLKNVQDGKTTFDAVAKASSKDAFASKGGLEGAKLFYDMSSEFANQADAEKVAALKKGELSPVLKTASGAWAFFKAEADPAAADFTQGSVSAAVRGYLNGRSRGVIEDWAIAQAKALAATPSGLEAAAKKAGVAVKTIGPFPLNYGDLSVSFYGQSMPLFQAIDTKDNPELAGASTNEKFLTAAFSLAPGAVSEPIVIGDNVVVLRGKESGAVKDDKASMIDYGYSLVFQNAASSEIRDLFMKSPLLKDDFGEVFNKYFQPAKPSKQG